MGKTVMIGMSGGVDSSVAAYLLKQQGYNVVGVTMRLCKGFTNSNDSANVMMAKAVADKLGIDFMDVDYMSEFNDWVVQPFIDT